MNLLLCDNYDTLLQGAIASGVDYIENNSKIRTLVVGISGGVDSAVTAAIARLCCNILRKKNRTVNLFGVHLIMDGTKNDETVRARNIAKEFCDQSFFADLGNAYESVIGCIDDTISYKIKRDGYTDPDYDYELSPSEKIRAGNVKARLRMMYLYNLANASCGMVLSTDNLTEYNLGFWTLHGDVGDFGLIQNCWKTEVFGIAKLLGNPVSDCSYVPPTDGLGVTNTSLDQILPGWENVFKNHYDAYKYVDDTLISYLSIDSSESKDHHVIRRHINSKFKRENPYNVSRDMLLWTYNKID
jgi:NAD+ synthetase